MVHEIRVGYKSQDFDTKAHQARQQISQNLGQQILVTTENIYYLEGVNRQAAEKLAKDLFCDPLTQTYTINGIKQKRSTSVVVGYLPGVTNPQRQSIEKAAQSLGVSPKRVETATAYNIPQNLTHDQIIRVARAVANPTVDRLIFEKPKTLFVEAEAGETWSTSIIYKTDKQLEEIRHDKPYMTIDELKVIRSYFQALGREPTTAEMEVIEARWSEHCVHKTFRAKVITDGVEKPPLFERIVKTSEELADEEDVSSFVDNSGVIRFYDGQAVCGKVETHNRPCAIEPYGGAMTGSGGVFRDPLGTGLGAKLIASTDMHCFAPPDMDLAKLPKGCLPPKYLLQRVIAGVRDYGNPTGIPTNNGSVHFDESFRANPTVIVGAYGILPEDKAQKGKPQVGDLVVAIGGKTGKDGIHGATYSSREMKGDSVVQFSNAVQIGNPIEEKRVIDAILECRDGDLIRALTDCGAAGFSSAIGEMGEETGVEVDISLAPLKYSGLEPWEIWMSESQERMVLAIDPSDAQKVMETCRKYNTEATVLGQFTDSKKLVVKYGEKVIIDLDYDFLINGLPQQTIETSWQRKKINETVPDEPTNWLEVVERVLSDYNVCSKEPIVRQFDHGVQGTNVLPPFSGVELDGPNDATILTPILGKPYGLIISHGMNPAMMDRDPYEGTVWAVAEAMANYVAVGGDPKYAKWINNYIWPSINSQTMGSLDLCVDAVTDCMKALKNRVVSGKDSLSSTYRGFDGKSIEIQSVFCLSVLGKIPDVEKTVTADIKKPGSTLFLVGKIDKGMGGTVYYKQTNSDSASIPKINLQVLPKVLEGVHNGIKSGDVLACHDVSEGGIITTVIEMCFGGDCGVDLTLDYKARADMFLFNETAGCFVLEVEDEETGERLFENIPHIKIGTTKNDKEITVKKGDEVLFKATINRLKQTWQEPMRRYF